MKIVWDEPKRLSNFEKHRLDFESLTAEFFEESTITPTRNGRFLAVGILKGIVIAVVFAARGEEAVSIISLRPASRKERRER